MNFTYLSLNFTASTFWEKDNVTEFAKDVSFIDHAERIVSFLNFIQGEVGVLFADN